MQRMGHLKEQGGCLEVADAVECQFVVLSVSAVAVGRGQLCLDVVYKCLKDFVSEKAFQGLHDAVLLILLIFKQLFYS